MSLLLTTTTLPLPLLLLPLLLLLLLPLLPPLLPPLLLPLLLLILLLLLLGRQRLGALHQVQERLRGRLNRLYAHWPDNLHLRDQGVYVRRPVGAVF